MKYYSKKLKIQVPGLKKDRVYNQVIKCFGQDKWIFDGSLGLPTEVAFHLRADALQKNTLFTILRQLLFRAVAYHFKW